MASVTITEARHVRDGATLGACLHKVNDALRVILITHRANKLIYPFAHGEGLARLAVQGIGHIDRLGMGGLEFAQRLPQQQDPFGRDVIGVRPENRGIAAKDTHLRSPSSSGRHCRARWPLAPKPLPMAHDDAFAQDALELRVSRHGKRCQRCNPREVKRRMAARARHELRRNPALAIVLAPTSAAAENGLPMIFPRIPPSTLQMVASMKESTKLLSVSSSDCIPVMRP